MLEVSWHALEDAGLDPERLKGSRAGMYVGISHIEYRGLIYESNDLSEPATGLYTLTGTPLNAVSGRVAYVLGLNGPAFAMDAACSSSLGCRASGSNRFAAERDGPGPGRRRVRPDRSRGLRASRRCRDTVPRRPVQDLRRLCRRLRAGRGLWRGCAETVCARPKRTETTSGV